MKKHLFLFALVMTSMTVGVRSDEESPPPDDPPVCDPAFPYAMSSPASGDVVIGVGQSWTPPYYDGTGGSRYIFCVAGYTHWQADAWTPPGPGTYSFWVGLIPDPGFHGNIDDPLIGNIQCSGQLYTLTVE